MGIINKLRELLARRQQEETQTDINRFIEGERIKNTAGFQFEAERQSFLHGE